MSNYMYSLGIASIEDNNQ